MRSDEGLFPGLRQHVCYLAILTFTLHLASGFQIFDVCHSLSEGKPLLRCRELIPGLSGYVPLNVRGYLQDILLAVAEGNQYFVQPDVVVFL